MVMGFKGCEHYRGLALAFVLMLGHVALPTAYACGLEPALKDGLTVSYPGALAVAVAVADSRRSGLLPAVHPVSVSNDVVLQQMLGDLKRLQARLDAGPPGNEGDATTAFSLVLIGPGLWSHYHPTPDGMRAEYHVNGPLAGQAVVLTHHSVLRALLEGSLTTEQATRLGLLAFSGDQGGSVRKALENGFPSST
jgi:hypothetical protein